MFTPRSRRNLLALSLAGSIALSPASAADSYQPDPALLAAAQKEGQVLIYTTLIVDQIIRPMIKAFQSQVPGVEVKYIRADGSVLVARLLNEARAGRVQADAWFLVEGFDTLFQSGAVTTFELPSAKTLPSTLVDPNKRWVATNLSIRSMAHNTDLVPKESAPSSYQDLLDPRWKGKFAWNPSFMTSALGFIATVIADMGEEKGMAYLRALAKQNITPLPISIRGVLDRVIAGEYAMGLEMNSTHVAASVEHGAPIRWVPLNPASMTLQVGGLTKEAPRPNAGKLFLDFMISKAGQNVFRESNYLPMHPEVSAKIPELKPEQGGFRTVLYRPDDIDRDVQRWSKVYQDIFR
jgi:iron(III) transport system substrate-binding protein